jgi:hypothetical protein
VVGPFPPTEGQHTNTATATGVANGTTVTNTDTANYLGAVTPTVINGFTVVYGGRVFANNQTTFTYIVSGTGVPPDLSHFDVQIPICSPRLNVVAYSPTSAVSFGIDPTTGVNGIKWGLPLKVNESRTYTITFEGNVVEGTVLVAVKGGNGFQAFSILGPSCTVSSIDVEKLVSVDGGATWQDADAAPGPDAPLGTEVFFRFVVTNNGNNELSSISLSDSLFEVSGCTVPSTLAAGAFFECVIGPIGVVAGQHSNTATASGSFAAGGILTSDTDKAHYFGGDRPEINVEKFISINGGATWHDADGSGIEAESGTNVSFKFVVTNSGNVALSSLTLADSVYDTSGCVLPATLEPGASFECVIGPFPAGDAAHTNTATVTATFGGQSVTDTDNASYRPPDDDALTITIVIEGPVDSINVNIITIFGIDIEVDPNNPILTQIRIGDTIRVEGDVLGDGATLIIIAVNIIIIDVDVVIVDQSGAPVVVPSGCKLTGFGNNRIRCKGASGKGSGSKRS